MADPNPADVLTYSIIADNAGNAFAINAATGVISVFSEVLEFESQALFELTVQVTDNRPVGALSAVNTVAITITDVNEAPVLTATSRSVNENSAVGVNIGAALAAVDPDDGDSVTYSMSHSLFKVASGGQLQVKSATLNHERQSSYTVTVTARDSKGLTSSAPITVVVDDVNDAPSFAASVSASIREDTAPGSAVGSVVSASDEDGDTLMYAIVSGNGEGFFVIDSASGQVTTSATAGGLDYDAGSRSFSLGIRATDTSGATATTVLPVSLLDVNEAPTLSASDVAIAEDEPVGATVLSSTASDPDAGESLTYAIVRRRRLFHPPDVGQGDGGVASGPRVGAGILAYAGGCGQGWPAGDGQRCRDGVQRERAPGDCHR